MFGGRSSEANAKMSSRQVAALTLPHANPPLRLRAGEDMAFDDGDMQFVNLDTSVSNLGLGSSTVVAGLSTVFGGASQDIAAKAAVLEEMKDRLRNSQEFSEGLKPAVVAEVLDRIMRAEVAALHAMSGVGGGSVLKGLSATSKGLVVPYEWYEKALNVALEGVDTLFRRHMHDGQPVVDLTRDEGVMRPSGFTLRDGEVPPQCDELLSPFDDTKLAARVAVVWRMLEQVSGSIPGMTTALRAFEGILPSIYDGFEKVAVALPPVTNLAAQVEQLAGLPTKASRLRASILDTQQLSKDVHYVRGAMQNWGFQIWYRQMLSARRRNMFLVRVGNSVQGLVRKTLKQTVLVAWRQYTAQRKLAKQFREMRQAVADSTTAMVKRPSHRKLRTDLSDVADERRAEGATLSLADAAANMVREAREGKAAKEGESPVASPASADPAAGDGDAVRRLAAALNDDFLAPDEIDAMRTDTVAAVKQLDLIAEVCRSQLESQREEIRRLSKDRDKLQQKSSLLEKKVLDAVKAQTAARNEADRVKTELLEAQREVRRLQSRIALQEHHAWRDAAVEATRRVALLNEPEPETEPLNVRTEAHPMGVAGHATANLNATVNMGAVSFGDDLNPAEVALRDWVNHCLTDLTSIERGALNVAGTKARGAAQQGAQSPPQSPRGSALPASTGAYAGRGAAAMLVAAQTARAKRMDEEFRDGVILSRLLFYLCLPRYKRESVAENLDASTSGGGDSSSSPSRTASMLPERMRMRRAQSNFEVNRSSSMALDTTSGGYDSPFRGAQGTGTPETNRELLFSRDPAVTLRPLFPHYMNSFSDFPNLPFTERAEVLVEGFSQILEVPERLFDPLQISEGFPHAIRLLLSLLYLRFAHPMQHKAQFDINSEKTGEELGLVGLLPSLSTNSAKAHTLMGKFWSPTFMETSQELSAFMHFFVDQQQSVIRYKWAILKDLAVGTMDALRARSNDLPERQLLRHAKDKQAFKALCIDVLDAVVDDAPMKRLQEVESKQRHAELRQQDAASDDDSPAGASMSGAPMSDSDDVFTRPAPSLAQRVQELANERQSALRAVQERSAVIQAAAAVMEQHHSELIKAFSGVAQQLDDPDGSNKYGVTMGGWKSAVGQCFIVPQKLTMSDAFHVYFKANPGARDAIESRQAKATKSSKYLGAGGGRPRKGSTSSTLMPRPPRRGSVMSSTAGPVERRQTRAATAHSTGDWENESAVSHGAQTTHSVASTAATMAPVALDDTDAAHCLSFTEFIHAVVRIAYMWTPAGSGELQQVNRAASIRSAQQQQQQQAPTSPTVELRSPTLSAVGPFSSTNVLGKTRPAVGAAAPPPAASPNPAGADILAGVSSIANVPQFDSLSTALEYEITAHWALVGQPDNFDNFLGQIRTLPVQRVISARYPDLYAAFCAYSRLFAEDYAMDVGHFVKLLKDSSLLTHDFAGPAAQELFQQILDHESATRRNAETLGVDLAMNHLNPHVLYGSGSPMAAEVAAARDNARRESTVSEGEAEAQMARARVMRHGRGAGMGIAASLKANMLRIHNFIQAVCTIAVLRMPNPIKPLSEKVDAVTKHLLDALRPKIAQQLRTRNAAGAAVVLPRSALRGSSVAK